MPKRGGIGNRFATAYFEHDNRGEEVRRTVSFKSVRGHPGGGGSYSQGRGRNQPKWNRLIRNHLQYDTDIDMGGSGRPNVHSGDHRQKFTKGRGRNARQSSPAPMRVIRNLPQSNSKWYQVTIRFGSTYEKKWIVDSLNAGIAPATFTPYGFGTQGKDSFFYVDDHSLAVKFKNMDRRISTEDGFKLQVLVRPIGNFLVAVDEPLKEVLKNVMAKRFRADLKALDLSRFHADPDLGDKFAPLNQKPVLTYVLTLVVEHCSSLHALDISFNHISSLDGVKSLLSKLSSLRILHLANNQMTHIGALDPLKGLPVEELLMDANPLCAKYTDEGAYVTDVRKRFPKLLKLDGRELPPPILFDVETAQLPPSKGSYMCADAGKEIARQFLEAYYRIYDMPDREPLRDAYHENAMLSLSCSFPPQSQGSSNRDRDKVMLGAYFSSNRNLKRIGDLDRRMRFLMCGHSEIMKHLCSLPGTQHDPGSFAVDLLLFTPQLIQICVCGVFRETRPSSNTPMRAFNRTIVLVPQGQGFCIVNETITVTNATSAQSKAAFKTSLQPVAPVPSVSAPVVPLAPVAVSPTVGQDIEAKRQMVEHVARVSGMNLIWSERCLADTNWNLEQALYAFTELNRQGNIPEEAFAR